jgi:tetratricopeptide (TPR) repeat protein
LSDVLYEVSTVIFDDAGQAQEIRLNLPSIRVYAVDECLVLVESYPPSERKYQLIKPLVGVDDIDAERAEATTRGIDEAQRLPAYRCSLTRLFGRFGAREFTTVLTADQEPHNLGVLVTSDDGESRLQVNHEYAADAYRGIIASREHDYRRSADAGNDEDRVALGQLLDMGGDMAGAEAEYRRAAENGSGGGSATLGWLLERNGNLADAESAYLRADERGSGSGAHLLGLLRRKRGDLRGALDAFRRADERGDSKGSTCLGVALEETGDPDGACEAYKRGAARGDYQAARNLCLMYRRQGNARAATAAWHRAETLLPV